MPHNLRLLLTCAFDALISAARFRGCCWWTIVKRKSTRLPTIPGVAAIVRRDCLLDPGAIAWAYFRDSGGEAQERSVGQQLDVAREYAAKHDLHLTLTFADEARQCSTAARKRRRDPLLQIPSSHASLSTLRTNTPLQRHSIRCMLSVPPTIPRAGSK